MELKLRKAQEKDLDGLDQVMLVISDAAGERETVKRLLKKIDADPQKYLLVAEDLETGTICGSLFGVVFEDICDSCRPILLVENVEMCIRDRGYTAQLGGAFTPAGERLDDVVALVYRGPKSYTGEDVVELSCHGGLYVTKRLLQLVLDAGASPAGPGEFTRRAFLNGKVDLAQAEAVMGVIGASGEQALKAAQAGSSGVLSKKIQAIKAQLLVQASHLAAWADFPEEDVPAVEEQEMCIRDSC